MTNVKVTNMKNTAGKSANENSDNNDNEDTGHISDNFYFLFFVCFEGFPE